MSRHVDGPCKGRVNNSEQLTQPDPKPAGTWHTTWFLRAPCAAPVRFVPSSVRPTERPSVPCSTVCSWAGWSLTRVLTRLVAAWTTRSIVPETRDLACESVQSWSFAKDTIDCQVTRKCELLWKRLLLREFTSLYYPDSHFIRRCVSFFQRVFFSQLVHSFKHNQWNFRGQKLH